MSQDPGEIPLNRNYKDLFDKYDTDGDGHLNIGELRQLIESREYQHDIPEHVIKIIHERADKDNNGQIDFKEFLDMIQHPDNEFFFGHYIEKISKGYVNYLIPRRHDRTLTQVDGKYEDQYKCCPPPLGMILISIIEVVLFIVDESQGSTIYANGPIAENLIYDPSLRRQCWRYITYMFVHIGFMHLIVNLLVQLLLGIPLEMVHHWWRVLLIYFAGVLAGSLFTSIMDPTVKLAGASGGVYSLITAHIATIILNWNDMHLPGIQLLIFLIITVVDTGTAIYNRYFLNMNEHIGYAAHFAGALSGLLVGILILRNIDELKWEKICKYISLVLYITLIGAAIIWNATYTDYFPPEKYT